MPNLCSYYRDANIIGIYKLVAGSRSLAKCGQLCGMDWETLTLAAGADGNLAEEAFTSQQLCEAFVFNPQNGRCILNSGLSDLNLRESNRYYSGYLQCPEPTATFTSTILQPPGSVSYSCASTTSITINWGPATSATGYLVTCLEDGVNQPSLLAPTTATSYTTTNLAANTTFNCYVSSYKYEAVSKGSQVSVDTTCS